MHVLTAVDAVNPCDLLGVVVQHGFSHAQLLLVVGQRAVLGFWVVFGAGAAVLVTSGGAQFDRIHGQLRLELRLELGRSLGQGTCLELDETI